MSDRLPGSMHQARAAIDAYLNDQSETAIQRQKRNVESLRDFYADLESSGMGGWL